jgi:hypothetical protein
MQDGQQGNRHANLVLLNATFCATTELGRVRRSQKISKISEIAMKHEKGPAEECVDIDDKWMILDDAH